MKLVPLGNWCLHVMLYQMKLIKNVVETWILPFYVFLDQRNNQIPCKTRPKHKEVPHPLSSDLNTIVNSDTEVHLRLHSYIRLQLASE